jgi:3-oxoacyl-[acyl-carrier-protein] synthase II
MHRVVITGYGMVSPLGLSAQESWEALLKGQSGVGPVTLFDSTDCPVKIAAEIKGFDPEAYLDRREIRRQDRFQWIAQAAAEEALAHSGFEITDANRTRTGVVVCSGIGGLNSMEDQITTLYNEGARRVSPFCIPRIMANGAGGMISIRYGIQGPCFSTMSACASATDGIGIATHLMRAGVADAMLAGGAEAGVTLLGLSAFVRIGAYTRRTEHTPSPFSADRDGLVMGEGAAVLILETLEHARARGAEIYAEIVGYGASADAFHVTAPTEDGSGSALAITRALEDAGLNPEDIDYINAHGTGTPLNDESESLAVKRALGEQAYKIPISSIKSMIGHVMGATGALEAVFCTQAINDNAVPPTINYTESDEICDLDYIPNEAREIPVRVATSNSFGFGGHNGVLVFREFTG